MNRISTHILDLVRGKAASGVPVKLESQDASGNWQALASSVTDSDGRCAQLLRDPALPPGLYRLRFDTAAYFTAQQTESLYPMIEVTFQVREGQTHFHIPLLLSPNGYTTYRGT